MHIDVLVVDDRAAEADVTLFALRRAAPQAKVLWLKHGEDALHYLLATGDFATRSRRMPALVLLDADMPVVSGLCLLELMRAHPSTTTIPVVILTSSCHLRVAGRSSQFEADAYLAKPLDLDRSQAAIEAMLSRWLPLAAPSGGGMNCSTSCVSPLRPC